MLIGLITDNEWTDILNALLDPARHISLKPSFPGLQVVPIVGSAMINGRISRIEEQLDEEWQEIENALNCQFKYRGVRFTYGAERSGRGRKRVVRYWFQVEATSGAPFWMTNDSLEDDSLYAGEYLSQGLAQKYACAY